MYERIGINGYSERPLTANDVDNVANAITEKCGQLSPDMELVLEAFGDEKISANYAVAYLLFSEADLAAGNATQHESANS